MRRSPWHHRAASRDHVGQVLDLRLAWSATSGTRAAPERFAQETPRVGLASQRALAAGLKVRSSLPGCRTAGRLIASSAGRRAFRVLRCLVERVAQRLAAVDRECLHGLVGLRSSEAISASLPCS